MPTPLDRSHEALAFVLTDFLDAAHRIAPDQLTDLIASSAGELGARATRVWLADHPQQTLRHLTASAPEEPLPIDGTAAGRAFSTSEIVEHPGDVDQDRRLWVPLLDGVDRVGILEVEIVSPTAEGHEAFRHLASVATAEIVSRGRYTDHFTLTRRQRPMSLAAELQWQALPPSTFSTDDISVSGIMEPAYDIGGDTFDYALNGDRLGLAILDAVGHDLGSSTISYLALGAYRNSRRHGTGLADAAGVMDRVIKDQLGEASFATGQLAELDTSSGVLRWLNAGHPPPLLIRRGRVATLACRPRLPFGLGHVQPHRPPDIAEDPLEPGDGILFYSDGVVEARHVGGVDFGIERLEQFLHTAFAAGLPPAEALRRLSNAVLDFHGGVLRDDATTLLVVWQPDR
ncbi:PP2C family protein-serine/threonine phosphatase [soil metagenome]